MTQLELITELRDIRRGLRYLAEQIQLSVERLGVLEQQLETEDRATTQEDAHGRSGVHRP